MPQKNMTIPQMARELQAVEQTIRRYIDRFSEFFTYDTEGSIKRYKYPESLNVLKRIMELYSKGTKKPDIRDILAKEMQTFKPEVISEILESQPDTLSNEFLDVLKGIKQSLDNLTDEIRELKEAVKPGK